MWCFSSTLGRRETEFSQQFRQLGSPEIDPSPLDNSNLLIIPLGFDYGFRGKDGDAQVLGRGGVPSGRHATACAVSQTISWAIDSRRDDEDPAVVPLCNVDGATFARIRDYMVKHQEFAARPKGTSAADADAAKKERRAWEAQFMDVDTDTLYRLLLASNYLEIQELEDLCVTRAANLMMGKEPEEIRKLLNTKNDFTPEEEEENRKQNKWLWDY